VRVGCAAFYLGASPHAKKDAAAYSMICLKLPRTRNERLFYERRKTEWASIEVSNFELIPGIIPVVIYFTNELCDPTGRLLYTRRSLRDCAFFLERSQLLLTPRNSIGRRPHLARQILIPEFVYKGVGIHFQSPTLDLLPLQLRIPDCQPPNRVRPRASCSDKPDQSGGCFAARFPPSA
jgi:hypothetical protein